MSYIYDLLDTWASGGGPYTSIKMNATDNDSGSASLLMDLQVSTASKFSVSKAGSATFGGSITATASGSYVNAAGLSLGTGGAGGIFVSGGNAFTVNSSGGFRWSSNANVNVDTNGDLILTRRGIANLRLGAADTTGTTAPTPQFLSAQSWSSSTTNNQTGANFTIDGSQGTGTGAGGSIIFRVAPAGGTSNGVQNALAAALTITSTGAATFSSTVTSGGNFVMPVAASIGNSSGNQLAIGSGNIYPSSNPLSLGTFAVPFSFLALGTGSNAALLTADAANTLALRNGTAAQEMRVYETTTGTIYKAILGNRQLIKIAGAAFDNGAGASAGTITNAPAAGNPTKWIPIDDNGTTRHIPAW